MFLFLEDIRENARPCSSVQCWHAHVEHVRKVLDYKTKTKTKICYLRYSRLLGLARSCTVTVASSVEVTICLSLQNPGSSVFSGLGICSFAQNRSYHWATVSDSLCRSLKKSDRERITLISLNKRATVSNLLRSLMTKEPPWGIPSGRSWQKSNMSDSLVFGGD